MRDWSVLFFAFLLATEVAGCATTPPISVIRTSPGEATEDVKGDPIKLHRGEQDAFSGGKAGYRVIRVHDDWNGAWPVGKVPDMPESAVDPKRHMLIFATAESRNVTNLKIKRALETAEFIYVYISESKLGEGCLQKRQERAYDAVTTTRIEKPVKFFIETEPGETCGPPPVTSVECRIGGQERWSAKITASPGDAVECAINATSKGKFEIIERHVSMGELPAGSAGKFKFKPGTTERGTFEVDAYGTYTIKAEAADEGGRHSFGTATVEVKPPKTKDVLVQLVWSGFDIKDVADSFPRVNLRVSEGGARGQRCSADIPVPGLCEVKTRGSYTYMTIPSGARQLPISVQYLEERPDKGAAPCVHVWYDGARTAETCDHGKREAEEIWRVGTLDTSTGKMGADIPEPPPPPPPKPAKPAPKKK